MVIELCVLNEMPGFRRGRGFTAMSDSCAESEVKAGDREIPKRNQI